METFYFKAPSTIALQDKELQISRNHQVQRIALSDVKKIFLKKRKKSFLTSVLSIGSLLLENLYDLHIRTMNNREIAIRIRPEERPFLLEVISSIRRSRRSARDQNYDVTTFAN